MWTNKKLIFGLGLMQVMLSLSACSCRINYDVCPTYPIGGEKVGVELSRLSSSEFPATFEWLGRINKLRQELELCERK